MMSAALHALVIVAFVLMRPSPQPPSPPIYRVNLVAASPGERAAGVARPEPKPPTEAKSPTPPRPVTSIPEAAPAPARRRPEPASTARAQATPTTAAETPPRLREQAPPPPAGGGPVGGRGADVANVRTEGMEFPYPGYLQNIVRQIALRFKPPRGGGRRAEVMFLIHRDGSISNLNFRVPSGSYAFDVEARGAVESAAEAGAFGPLPRGFPDDVLPVIFSFDPRLIR
jgi:protein TonB